MVYCQRNEKLQTKIVLQVFTCTGWLRIAFLRRDWYVTVKINVLAKIIF